MEQDRPQTYESQFFSTLNQPQKPKESSKKKVLCGLGWGISIILLIIIIPLAIRVVYLENIANEWGFFKSVDYEEYNTDDAVNVEDYTVGKNLLTTYLPHIDSCGYSEKFCYYISLNEDKKIITVKVNEDDEKTNRTKAINYLDSIPLDFSNYMIIYMVTDGYYDEN